MSHFIEKAALGQLRSNVINLPKVAVSMNPSHPRPGAGDVVSYYITINKPVTAASVVIEQSNAVPDAAFDIGFYEALLAAADAAPGVSLAGNVLSFDHNFVGSLGWVRTIVDNLAVDTVHEIHLSNPVGVQISAGSASFVIKAEVPIPEPVTGNVTPGINVASGEFGGFASSLEAGSYTYPSPDYIQNMYNVGMRLFRVPFRAYRVLTALYGSLDETDFAKLDAVMAKINTLPGAILIADAHDYGAMRDPVTGTPKRIDDPERVGALADMWIRISQRWAQYGDKFRIGLMNEPQSPATDANGNTWTALDWRNAAVHEITLMRAAGVTQHIYIPGASWTGAHSWVSFGNAAAWQDVNMAPLQPCSFEVHQYLDIAADGTTYSGTSADAVVGAGSTVLADVTSWARAKGVTLYLGEFGFADNDQMNAEARSLLNYMNSNADVWKGWTAWSSGPLWNGSYFMHLGQIGAGDNIYQRTGMKLLMDYSMPSVASAAPTGISLNSSVSSAAAPQGNRVGKLSLLGVSSDDYYVFADTFTLVDSAGGRYQIAGAEVQVGATPLAVGESNTIVVRGKNRKGELVTQSFVMPVVQAPTVALSRVSAQAVNEGANITIRVAVTNPVANSGFDLWCGGGDPKQMIGDWESVVRPAFEAAGCTVQRVNATKMRIRFGPTTVSGNINVVWPTKPDNITETGQYQWNVFLDNMVGVVRTSGQSTFGYINDTSTSPPWSVAMNPASVFEGQTLTTTLSITAPVTGAKITVTPSGTAEDSDFNKTLAAAISEAVAAETGLSFDSGANVIEITGAWDGSVSWTRTVIDDADVNAETHAITLSDPVLSTVAIASASTTLRATTALDTVSQDYETGSTSLTATTGRGSVSSYEKEDGSLLMFAPNALRVGERGLLINQAGSNLIKNPRGLGGVIGTSMPTGWSVAGGRGLTGVVVGRGDEDGHSYVDIRLRGEAGTGSNYQGLIYLAAIEDIVAPPGEYTFTVGLKIVGGSPNGFVVATDPGVRSYTATGAGTGGIGSPVGGGAYGPAAVVFTTASGTIPAGTERLRPTITLNRGGAVTDPPVDMTVRIYSPTLTAGVAATVPLPVPANTNGPVYFGPETLSFDHEPDPEGALSFEWTPVSRKAGEVVCCLYSDADNWINVEYGEYGYLRLRASVNGLITVDVQGSFVVPGHRHKAAIRYAYGDWALILDGEVVGISAATALPPLTALTFGRNASGSIHSVMYLHNWQARNDQPANAVLTESTKMPPFPLNEAVNLAGAEYGLSRDGDFRKWTNVPNITHWVNKGFKRFRIPFRWENMQPVPFGPLDTNELNLCLGVLDMMEAVGAVALLDCHNYSAYLPKGNAKGDNWMLGESPELPNEAFADFWGKFALALDNHPAIWGYDLMNEPKASIDPLLASYRLAITAIRAVDTTSWIVAEGKHSAAAMRYTGESTRMRELIGFDPSNKLILGAHQYLDSNNAGQYVNSFPNGSDPETGYRRFMPYINYLKAYGQEHGHIGEFGWPAHPGWDRVGFNGLRTLRKYAFVYVDGWQAGPAVGAGDKNRLELVNGVDPTSTDQWERNLSRDDV